MENNAYVVTDDTRSEVEEFAKKVVDHEAIKNRLQDALNDVYSDLLDKVEWHLENDAISNVEGQIHREAIKMVEGMLKGDQKMLARFNLALGEPGWMGFVSGLADHEGIRRKIYEQHKEFIQNQLIDDLIKENQKLRDDVSFYRERRY